MVRVLGLPADRARSRRSRVCRALIEAESPTRGRCRRDVIAVDSASRGDRHHPKHRSSGYWHITARRPEQRISTAIAYLRNSSSIDSWGRRRPTIGSPWLDRRLAAFVPAVGKWHRALYRLPVERPRAGPEALKSVPCGSSGEGGGRFAPPPAEADSPVPTVSNDFGHPSILVTPGGMASLAEFRLPSGILSSRSNRPPVPGRSVTVRRSAQIVVPSVEDARLRLRRRRRHLRRRRKEGRAAGACSSVAEPGGDVDGSLVQSSGIVSQQDRRSGRHGSLRIEAVKFGRPSLRRPTVDETAAPDAAAAAAPAA